MINTHIQANITFLLQDRVHYYINMVISYQALFDESMQIYPFIINTALFVDDEIFNNVDTAYELSPWAYNWALQSNIANQERFGQCYCCQVMSDAPVNPTLRTQPTQLKKATKLLAW